MSEVERKEVETYWDKVRQDSEARLRKEEDLKWGKYSRLITKYLKRNVEVPRDRESYTFKLLVKEAYNAYEKKMKISPDDISDKEAFEMEMMKSYTEDPLLASNIGQTIYFNPNDPNYKVDNIHKYYLLTHGGGNNEQFWPFSKYTDTYYEFQKYNLTTFNGVFSGYDFSEFAFYVLLPLAFVYLRALYKRFVV